MVHKLLVAVRLAVCYIVVAVHMAMDNFDNLDNNNTDNIDCYYMDLRIAELEYLMLIRETGQYCSRLALAAAFRLILLLVEQFHYLLPEMIKFIR